MALTELPIKALFNGVSRQPHNVRLTSQVQEANNTLLSVVTGGFEKRPASQHVLTLSGLASSGEWAVHGIDRDATEQYLICIDNAGVLKVYDVVNNTTATVNSYSSAIQTYITTTNPRTDLAFVTIADHTLIVNREKVTALGSAAASGSVTFVDTFGDLTASGASGVHGVTNLESTLDDYYVLYDSTTAAWQETVKPGLQNSFDATTMPHKLVRESNGTWTLSASTWGERTVGDTNTVPAPQFIGKKIKDVFFFRNRLGMLADENVFFSQSGDFFNLWPDKATSVLDTDPIDIAASTTKVTLLRWAIPFRKSLFLSADRAQFELSTGGSLTPTSAVVDLATNYSTDNLAKPVALGDEIYFAGKSGPNAVFYEYFVEDDTLTNVAIDVTKHAEGYVPADVTMLEGDPTTGTLFAYTSQADGSDNDEVYVYRVFFDGTEKAQSAWSKWDFNCTAIKGMKVIDGFLYLITNRDSDFFIEKVPLMPEAADATLGHAIMLDCREDVSGTHSSSTGRTTWTLPFNHRSVAEGILPSGFGTDAGRKLSLAYGKCQSTITVTDFANISNGSTIVLKTHAGVSHTFTAVTGTPSTNQFKLETSNNQVATNLASAITSHDDFAVVSTVSNVVTISRIVLGESNLDVTSSDGTRLAKTNFVSDNKSVQAIGDFDAAAVTFGIPYTMLVELSKQFLREQDNSSILRGRYQIQKMRLYFTDSGFFSAKVTPLARDTETTTFTGRTLGDGSNIIGQPALSSDIFTFDVSSQSDTVKIQIENASHLPSIINAVTSIGFFNEIIAQG